MRVFAKLRLFVLLNEEEEETLFAEKKHNTNTFVEVQWQAAREG